MDNDTQIDEKTLQSNLETEENKETNGMTDQDKLKEEPVQIKNYLDISLLNVKTINPFVFKIL